MQPETATPKTILCPNCGASYPIEQTHCSACGQANPGPANAPAPDEALPDKAVANVLSRRPWWRTPVGCASITIFLLLVAGGVLLGGYQGLQEQTARKQAEVDEHYQKALAHLDKNELELAVAELNQTLTLDPAHHQARDLLRQLKSEQTKPAPTPLPTPAANLPAELFAEAKALTQQGNWEDALARLTQIRDMDPTFEPALISEALFTANYELGLRLMAEEKLPQALHAFDEALVERPNDPQVTTEWEKVSLYLSLDSADPADFEGTIVVLSRLNTLDPDFADVKTRLFNAYLDYGNALAEQQAWCLAQPRYESAAQLIPGPDIEALAAAAEQNCELAQRPTPAPTPTPASAAVTVTVAVTATTTVTAGGVISTAGTGTLYFARLNAANTLWEIIALDPVTGREEVILSNATQPAISAGGGLLAYHSEQPDAVGLHTINLATQEDLRATTYAEDILPRWGSDTQAFVFASQRSGDRRWQIFTGFADGLGDAVYLHDGRTPTLSGVANTIFYQGTDSQGNNPGIYRLDIGGGEPVRITTDQSDRSPAVSPDGSRLAFMSTRRGAWDIWGVASDGGSAALLAASPGNDGLPVWSPDGALLAFVSDRDGSWGIYITGAQGGQARRVADWGTQHPDWLVQQLSWGF